MARCRKNSQPNSEGNSFSKGLTHRKANKDNWGFYFVKIEKVSSSAWGV